MKPELREATWQDRTTSERQSGGWGHGVCVSKTYAYNF